MVELHGWITVRETYEMTEEENDNKLMDIIGSEIAKLKYFKPNIRRENGRFFIDFFKCANHMSSDVTEILSFLEKVGKVARGSYGLLYIHNDEDEKNYNHFMIYRLARGEVQVFRDELLSPIVPILEDEFTKQDNEGNLM